MFRDEIKTVITTSNENKEIRKFGITIGVFLMFVAVILLWRQNAYSYYFLGGGLIFLLLCTTTTFLLKPMYVIWMVIAVILGFFMTRLILTLFFYLILTPVGLIIKLLKKDPLKERIDKKAKTYWIKRENKVFDIKSIENQY